MLTLDAVSKRFALKAGYFAAARRHVYAVREVSLRIAAGETYGLVGESGSGKTTTARLAVGMYRPDGGAITYRDRAGDLHEVGRSGARARRELRTRLAYVFQDPARSLNPRMRVESILLAGLGARGETCVSEPVPTRDHTERMLPSFGVSIERSNGRACLTGRQPLRATRIDVPGDFSSATFLLLAGLIGPREIRVESVGVNSARTGFLRLMDVMGGDLQVAVRRTSASEPVADVMASPSMLQGALLPASFVPSAIDEMPAVFAAAACAMGETVIQGAEELRVKESDRIAAMVSGLKSLGVVCEETPDGARIRGGGVRGGEIDCKGDHRVAMAFAVLALAAQAPIIVRDVDCVDTSFPGFAEIALQLGLNLEPIK